MAIGLAMICRAGHLLGFCHESTRESVIHLLHQFGLPTAVPYPPEDIYNAALSDKKRAGDTVHLIVPQKIGNCMIHSVQVEQLKSFIEAGM